MSRRQIGTTIAVLAATVGLSQGAFAANKVVEAKKFQDVETLNDHLGELNGKAVSVRGSVNDRIDSRSFVLESGGILNDEIVVLLPKSVSANIKESETYEVSGVIRKIPLTEARKTNDWDLNPQTETRLQRVQTFLIANKVSKVVND